LYLLALPQEWDNSAIPCVDMPKPIGKGSFVHVSYIGASSNEFTAVSTCDCNIKENSGAVYIASKQCHDENCAGEHDKIWLTSEARRELSRVHKSKGGHTIFE
jgi:hypothetical protein